jgi:hypothetical protein
MNILIIIFFAPIAFCAGCIALGLFIRFFWVWAGLGLVAVASFVGYFCWLETSYWSSPYGKASAKYNQEYNTLSPQEREVRFQQLQQIH